MCCVRLISMLRIAHSFGRQFFPRSRKHEKIRIEGRKGKYPSHGRRKDNGEHRKGDGKSDVAEELARESGEEN